MAWQAVSEKLRVSLIDVTFSSFFMQERQPQLRITLKLAAIR